MDRKFLGKNIDPMTKEYHSTKVDFGKFKYFLEDYLSHMEYSINNGALRTLSKEKYAEEWMEHFLKWVNIQTRG